MAAASGDIRYIERKCSASTPTRACPHPRVFLCKNKNGSGKLKTTETISAIILNDSPPQYHPTEGCSILYVKYKNTSSIWDKIKSTFKKENNVC